MRSKFYGNISLEPEIFKKPTILSDYAETRNYSVSDVQVIRTAMPIWTDWTLRNAVQFGYKGNGWVYRCVFLIAKSLSSVQWRVEKNGEPLPEHNLTRLFKKPNLSISRQDIFEMLAFWLELSGNAYFLKDKSNGKTLSLTPISPDRIKPVPSRNMGDWIDGFILDEFDSPKKFSPEEIIHLKFLDPVNPLIGISPLEVAGKTVDTDTAQKTFNAKSAANYGVIDGVFTFQREFAGQDDADAVAEKLDEKYRKKRGFLVIGSNAKYERIALTQQEMDFNESRRFNRDEICAIFGVPPQLIGSQESMTYDNYFLSLRIFWDTTIIPMLDDIADSFNFEFQDELTDEEVLTCDLSGVSAVQEAQVARTDTGKKLWDMGVPMSEINRKLKLGISEYPGWDKNPINNIMTEQRSESYSEKKKPVLTLIEVRNYDPDAEADKRDDFADKKNLPKIIELFDEQKKAILNDISGMDVKNVKTIIYRHTLEKFEPVLKQMYLDTGTIFGQKIVVETRDSSDVIREEIDKYLQAESATLIESSQIAETTVAAIVSAVEQGLQDGWSATQLQEAIILGTAFSPERSLMLARTITGTAASLGQYKSAELAGAQEKIWVASMAKSRTEHIERSGTRRKMNERFAPKFGAMLGPMFPLDRILKPADRVNCRCSMYFRSGIK